ncbi:MAG: hypothetical protein HQ588_01985 [Deltaproteobacteria bacterium]|nr:hypothetical protein [Deltaproteobacteria bacterium]
MRKLLFVPVIHMEPDLGSEAAAIDSKSASLFGEERWAKHKDSVVKFWENIADYFTTVNASPLKVYQDGLPADGALGRKIVEEAAKRGSKNHQIILSLMARGAEISKTEDPSLLQEEYEYITRLTRSRSIPEKTITSARYKLRKNQLTKERDKFVAKTIDETLKEGETGVLFMGSYHNIFPYLPKDIVVKQLKNREKINAYFRELVSGGDGERFEQLAKYLASPYVA